MAAGAYIALVVVIAIAIILFVKRSSVLTFLTASEQKLIAPTTTNKTAVNVVPDTTQTTPSGTTQALVFTTPTGGTRVVKNADPALIARIKLNLGLSQ